MMGPPGTGKTLLARAIAGEAGVPFFSICGSDFVEMFVGVGASRVRDLFEQGKKNAPCIIFIDEIDAVGRHRGAGLGGGHDEREQTLNQLLVEMDGFESNDGVIIIAATNRPDVLDPALLRPGRFDRRIVVPRPDVRGRDGHPRRSTPARCRSRGVDLEVIARGTPGFSGADLEFLVNEAALLAARRDKDKVEMEDFEEAKDKVLMGAERRSMIISEKEKRTTAVHEAGHALVARFAGDEADPVHKVTIIPRGRALGVTQQLPAEDRLNMTREFAQNQIAILMGGRVAEEIVFGQKTTGAGNDIERATELARSMVSEWGMSDEFGPLNFSSGKQEVFLGRDFASGDRLSEDTAQRIDAEIRRIVIAAVRARDQDPDRAPQGARADRRGAARVRDARRRRHRHAAARRQARSPDLGGAPRSASRPPPEARTARRPASAPPRSCRRSARREAQGRPVRREPGVSRAIEPVGPTVPGTHVRPSATPLSPDATRLLASARRWASSTSRPTRSPTAGSTSTRTPRSRTARALLRDGADILDVGGEATNPRAAPVDARTRSSRRVLPVIEALAAAGAIVSIDTTKAEVARAAVAAGATIVNDVSGGLFDPEMAAAIARPAT